MKSLTENVLCISERGMKAKLKSSANIKLEKYMPLSSYTGTGDISSYHHVLRAKQFPDVDQDFAGRIAI